MADAQDELKAAVIEHTKASGMRRLILASINSLKGLRRAMRAEAPFRREHALAFGLVPAGLRLGESSMEKALLAASVLLVRVVELQKTALEAVVHRVGLKQHVLSGRAKDVG